MLNELSTDEWANVGLIEYVLQCSSKVLLRRLPGGKRSTREQNLRIRIVRAFHRGHRHCVIRSLIGKLAGAASCRRRKCPTRIGPRESLHLGLGVSGNRIAAGVHLRGTVGIKLHQTQGEKLHQFARVVLVCDLGNTGHRPGFVAVDHIEVHSHGS